MNIDQFEEEIKKHGKSAEHNLHTFTELAALFEQHFNKRYFPAQPATLYDASQYLLTVKGKRIRPVMCLMGNELFGTINEDAWHVAAAIELFHNFTLVHDDIMDKAPLRRNRPTVHTRYGESTALLAGDVMLVAAYESINKIDKDYIHHILGIFNETSKKVCEGQQLDIDFEKLPSVSFEDYENMISLKTSVLLAASLQMGAALGGAGLGNQQHLYEFGRNLGIAFQVQDDYLDAFGDPEKFGKKTGGDIVANKKTFLLIETLNTCSASQKEELAGLMQNKYDEHEKIKRVIDIYKSCKVDEWARELKQKYMSKALANLEDVAVLSSRKKPLQELANYLLDRES
ncbi:MAG TPA: polyprenyl synthetase family protein [Chitinophagaceae bacterium]|nr:polyprenyl synthetase family protein [Chitinophagaceae bacterium]